VLDADDTVLEVNVRPSEPAQLAASKPRVHRRRPQSSVASRQGLDQRGPFDGLGDSIAPAS